MTGDCHVRICGGLGVRFPRATRPETSPSAREGASWASRAGPLRRRRSRHTVTGPSAHRQAHGRRHARQPGARSAPGRRQPDQRWGHPDPSGDPRATPGPAAAAGHPAHGDAVRAGGTTTMFLRPGPGRHALVDTYPEGTVEPTTPGPGPAHTTLGNGRRVHRNVSNRAAQRPWTVQVNRPRRPLGARPPGRNRAGRAGSGDPPSPGRCGSGPRPRAATASPSRRATAA